MKAIRWIIVFSLIHFLLLAGFFSLAVIAQGGLFAEVELSGKRIIFSEACWAAAYILAFPLFSVLDMFKKPIPDLIEWSVVVLNSLLYGTGAWGIVKLLSRKRMGSK